MKTTSEAMLRMIKGRVGLIAREPFFAQLALEKLALVEDQKAKTTWCDGRRLGFNPEHVLAFDSIEDLEAIWAHHVATCALGHPFRRGSRDAALWNDASDHCVNSYITQAGFQLPAGSLYDRRFDGMYIEQIYHLLQQEQLPQGGNDDGQGSSEGNHPGDRSGDEHGADDDADGQGRPGRGNHPGGHSQLEQRQSGGDETPGEDADGSPDAEGAGVSATGEVRDATDESDQNASSAELAEQARDWETSVAQAEQASRAAGRLSGSTGRLAKASLQAKVDWREALQRLLRAKSKDDYNYRKLSKRSFVMGFVLPSLDAPRCGTLTFAIDVSGSINDKQKNQFLSEVEDARQTCHPEKIIILFFDYGVRARFEFGPDDPIEVGPVFGGGGTSFIHPVLVCNEFEEPPEVLVFLTDLCSNAFAEEPSYPVVWVTTEANIAPYGDVIEML